MTIIRQPRPTNFTVINNDLLNDPNLSMKALGVLVFILGKPDNWQTKTYYLCERFQCGEKAMLSALKEIEGAGYLQRIRHRDAKGVFQWTHTISDTPSIPPFSTHGLSTHGSPTHGLSTPGKPADITNTDSTKTDQINTDQANTDVEDAQAKNSEANLCEEQTSSALTVEKTETATGKFEPFRTAYNENRPRFWPEMQVVNPKRQKFLRELIRDCGGTEPAIAALTNALKYAAGDAWYSSKTLNFENFASNGKILQLHERFMAQFDSGIPAEINTQANRETALEVQRMAEFLKRRQEAK